MNRRTFLRLPALAALDLPKYKVVTPHQAAAKYESAADGRRHRQISSSTLISASSTSTRSPTKLPDQRSRLDGRLPMRQ